MLATEKKKEQKTFDRERIQKALDSQFITVNKRMSKEQIKALLLSKR